MSERDHLGLCAFVYLGHLEVTVFCTSCDVSVSECLNLCSNLSGCMAACTCTLWYLAQMTVVNCFLSAGLSILITVTKSGANRSYLFHLTVPRHLFKMTIMNDSCCLLMCFHLYACHNKKMRYDERRLSLQ